MLKRLSCLLASLSFLLAFSVAHASIDVTPILIDVKSSDLNKQDIRVYNRDPKNRAVVTIAPSLVKNPGTASEKFLPIKNPRKSGLLVFPKLLVIPPGQMRTIRLVLTQNNVKHDKIYRIDVKPTVGDLVFPKGSNEVGVKVLVGYGVVVVQRPDKINVAYTAKQTDHTLVVRNTGNTNFVLANAKQCDSNGKQCKNLPAKRIYAGKTWTVKLPYTTPVEYQLSYLQTVKTLNVKR